jgi:hypothetical protein
MKIMRKLTIATVLILAGCTIQKNPDKGTEYGIIQNPSAEITDGSVVKGWTSDQRARFAVHFYDNVAQSGTKSLFIQADRFTNGRWSSKVLLKPWSKYRFSGWIKTENIISETGKGAGFRMDGLEVEPEGFTGTNDWTKVNYEFETGNNDCVTLACILGIDGNSKGRVWFDNMSMDLVSSEKISTDIYINISKKFEPMPVYIYGQFIEHLGRCIYGGIWAEMLEDRKFWYVPGARESAWRVTGEKSLFSMETKDPFSGSQTPELSSENDKKAILSQENLGLKENLDATGQVLKLYRHKFGFISVEISGETRPLEIGAALTNVGDTLTISVVNPTWAGIDFPLSVSGGDTNSEMELWKVTAPDDISTNEPGREPSVVIAGPEISAFGNRLKVGPTSISIFRIPIKSE